MGSEFSLHIAVSNSGASLPSPTNASIAEQVACDETSTPSPSRIESNQKIRGPSQQRCLHIASLGHHHHQVPFPPQFPVHIIIRFIQQQSTIILEVYSDQTSLPHQSAFSGTQPRPTPHEPLKNSQTRKAQTSAKQHLTTYCDICSIVYTVHTVYIT